MYILSPVQISFEIYSLRSQSFVLLQFLPYLFFFAVDCNNNLVLYGYHFNNIGGLNMWVSIVVGNIFTFLSIYMCRGIQKYEAALLHHNAGKKWKKIDRDGGNYPAASTPVAWTDHSRRISSSSQLSSGGTGTPSARGKKKMLTKLLLYMGGKTWTTHGASVIQVDRHRKWGGYWGKQNYLDIL